MNASLIMKFFSFALVEIAKFYVFVFSNLVILEFISPGIFSQHIVLEIIQNAVNLLRLISSTFPRIPFTLSIKLYIY